MAKTHSTNYVNTLIEVADDTTCTASKVPSDSPDKATVAMQQYALIAHAPYSLTYDDVVFSVWAERNGVAPADREDARERFFSTGQPCLRTSPLAKSHGFGIHADDESRIALVPMESDEYKRLQADPSVTRVQVMRSRRK